MPSLDGPLHRPTSFHARLTDKMKMKLLRRIKSSNFTPTITESPAESSSGDTSSSSSIVNSQSTSITVPSSDSSNSLSPTHYSSVVRRHSPDRRQLPRPKSECYTPRRHSTISTASSLTSTSPYAPRIISVQENQWVHQSVLLVFGQVGPPEVPCNGVVTVHHHLDIFPPTQWPVCEGYFKVLVRLDPGPNKLRFEFNATKGPSYSTILMLNMLPLAASPPLHLAIILAKDSTGEYRYEDERTGGNVLGTEAAQDKLRMAALLLQAFTGEQMYRCRLGRRCFRLEEEWALDKLSNQTVQCSKMKNIPKVHVIRCEETVERISALEKQRNGKELRSIAQKAVNSYFEDGSTSKDRFVGTVFFDVQGQLQFPDISEYSAISSGLGFIGSQFLHTLPSCIEDVVSAFSDCTRVGGSNNSESSYTWEAATTTLEAMIGSFLSPQSATEPRDLSKLNRTFLTKEPYSLRTKSQGLKLSLPKEECSWSRIECLHFRYHSCFRLPTDPVHPPQPDTPQVYAVENGLVVTANSGVTLVMMYTGGVYRDYIEYTSKPEREVLLQDDLIFLKLADTNRNTPVKLEIYSANKGRTIVEDYIVAKGSKIQLENGSGQAFKSSPLGNTVGAQSEVILHSTTAGRTLTGIRVFHDETRWSGLEFQYEDSSVQAFGKATTEASEFGLDARKGESLVGFQIRVGELVTGLEILTSFGRKSSVYGGTENCSVATLVPPRGRSIVGVAGSHSAAGPVDSFSILYK